MSAYQNNNRTKTAHYLPVLAKKTATFEHALPAALVAQIIVEKVRTVGEPVLLRPRRNGAVDAYRAAGRATFRHLPAGTAHTETV